MEVFMNSQTNSKSNSKLFAAAFGAIFCVILLMATGTTAYAAPQHGFGQSPSRQDTVNEQDFHTSQWDRFNANYQFTSGSDHRFDLGRSTTYSGFVPVDVFTVNMRRDANVSLRPPSYGVFSAELPTQPSNHLFAQPANPHFHPGFQMQDPNRNPAFDTLGHGVNAAPVGNPFNMQNVGAGEFLPPTSVLPPAR
jgi:hypothetical protein